VAIRGTRSILRDGQWFPRRGTISALVVMQSPSDSTRSTIEVSPPVICDRTSIVSTSQ